MSEYTQAEREAAEKSMPPMFINEGDGDAVFSLCAQYSGYNGYTGWQLAYRRQQQLIDAKMQLTRARQAIAEARELLNRYVNLAPFEPLNEGHTEEQQMRSKGDIEAENLCMDAVTWLSSNPERTA